MLHNVVSDLQVFTSSLFMEKLYRRLIFSIGNSYAIYSSK